MFSVFLFYLKRNWLIRFLHSRAADFHRETKELLCQGWRDGQIWRLRPRHSRSKGRFLAQGRRATGRDGPDQNGERRSDKEVKFTLRYGRLICPVLIFVIIIFLFRVVNGQGNQRRRRNDGRSSIDSDQPSRTFGRQIPSRHQSGRRRATEIDGKSRRKSARTFKFIQHDRIFLFLQFVKIYGISQITVVPCVDEWMVDLCVRKGGCHQILFSHQLLFSLSQ